jgi:hypothetical protein
LLWRVTFRKTQFRRQFRRARASSCAHRHLKCTDGHLKLSVLPTWHYRLCCTDTLTLREGSDKHFQTYFRRHLTEILVLSKLMLFISFFSRFFFDITFSAFSIYIFIIKFFILNFYCLLKIQFLKPILSGIESVPPLWVLIFFFFVLQKRHWGFALGFFVKLLKLSFSWVLIEF